MSETWSPEKGWSERKVSLKAWIAAVSPVRIAARNPRAASAAAAMASPFMLPDSSMSSTVRTGRAAPVPASSTESSWTGVPSTCRLKASLVSVPREPASVPPSWTVAETWGYADVSTDVTARVRSPEAARATSAPPVAPQRERAKARQNKDEGERAVVVPLCE